MKKIKSRIIFFLLLFIVCFSGFSQVCPGGNATGNLNPVVGNTYNYCFQCPSCSSQSGCLFMTGLNAGEQIVVNGTLYTGPLNYGNTGQVCVVGGAWSCFSIQFLTTATNLDLLWETDSGCPIAGYFVNYNNINSVPCSTPSVSTTSTTICQGQSGTITATGSPAGGSYLWSNGGGTGSSMTASPSSTTTYTVTYTVTGGCTQTATATINVNPSPTLSVNSPIVCLGNSTTLTANPSIPGGTYSWTPLGGTSSSVTISPISSFSYTVTYTAPNGCTATAVGNVTVLPSPTVSVNSAVICSGASATLNATTSTVGGSYLWNPGGAITPSIIVSPTSTTTYTVQYTAPNGCTKTATGTVTVNPNPTLTVNSATVCLGNPVTLTANPSIPGGTYSWTPLGGTSSSVTVSPISNFSFTVTYTAPTGCTATATGTVTVIPSPTVSVNSVSICNGQFATLNATASPLGGSYLWSPGGATSSSITVNPSSTTTYTVTYTSLNGCTKTATGLVTIKPDPTLSVDNDTICNGGTATLTATASPLGGVYSWSNGGGSGSSMTANPTSTTTYTVTYTSPNGCTKTATGTITVASATLTVSSATICGNNGPATITANPNPGGGTFLWNPTGGTGSSLTDNPAVTTTYTVSYTSLSGCTVTATGTINVVPTPTLIVNPVTICIGQSATLSANTSPSGGTYLWTPGGSNSTNITVNPTTTTTYTVLYTAPNGCTNSTTATVTVNPNPAVTVNSTTICLGQSATLTANGAISYFWSSGGTNNVEIVTPITTSTYTVTGISSGCSSTALSNVIVKANLSGTVNQSICQGNSFTFNGNVLTASGTYYDTLVSVDGCDSTLILNLTINPPLTGTINQSICQGNSFIFNGQTLTTSGTHKDTVQNGSGCDSIITLNLTVAPITNSISQSICQGNSIVFNGQTITTSGIYKDTLQTHSN